MVPADIIDEIDELQESAKRGGLFMDEKFPGWNHFIDRTQLDMANPRLCIFGQCYDGYFQGLAILELSCADAVYYGLTLTPTIVGRDTATQFKHLTKFWAREIKKRKTTAKPAAAI